MEKLNHDRLWGIKLPNGKLWHWTAQPPDLYLSAASATAEAVGLKRPEIVEVAIVEVKDGQG